MATTNLDLLKKAAKSLEEHDDLRELNLNECWSLERVFMVEAYERKNPEEWYTDVFDSGSLGTPLEGMSDINYVERL